MKLLRTAFTAAATSLVMLHSAGATVKADLTPTAYAQNTGTKSKASKMAPKPKVEYIKFVAQEPSEQQQRLILEAATKVGIRPGTLGALMAHESGGTWNPEIRPGEVKVAVSGAVKGNPTSTAVGIGQYIEPTWLRTMYLKGDAIAKDSDLAKQSPETMAILKAGNAALAKEIERRGGKTDWNAFKAIEKDMSGDKDINTLLALRSDKTSIVPIYAVAHDLRDYGDQIEREKLPINTTNMYVIHHTNVGTLSKLHNRSEDTVDGFVSAEAIAGNGLIFKKADGTVKTGAEALESYRGVVSDDHASNFERQYYGRDFGPPGKDDMRMRALKGIDGKTYQVRNDLVVPRLSDKEYLTIWDKPSPAATFDKLPTATAAFEKLGVKFGKTVPTDPQDPRFKTAVVSFKRSVGLPHPEKGEFDLRTVEALQTASAKAEGYIQLQQRQQAALGEAVDLKTIYKGIKKDDPSRSTREQLVIGVKQRLQEQGLISLPKAKKGQVAAFNGNVDNKLVSALNDYQRSQGLVATNGKIDKVTVASFAPKPAAPAVAAPTTTFNNTAAKAVEPGISTDALKKALGSEPNKPAPAPQPVIKAPVFQPR